ncbi:hypothetical protein B0T16DRAFT_459690 [Cercophora newfieldiana]|uniref:Uncharacterized protein n=1 Tax=Cercophora newfieldiana TaxID=92897 RepID=A0AA39Y1U0_9PEZI|nr:hypothetical protein B0T16DRAFT_459690 [Cercophora newfieldiana]
MSSGPASSRDYDRPRIQEQHRKRNAMAASGTTTPAYNGLPRVHSTLSNVSYPTMYASPIVQMPRAYSYSTTHLGEARYSMIDIAPSRTAKGKGVDKIMVDSGCASRSSSHASSTRKRASGSPTGSSNNSITSLEELEIKPAPHKPRRQSDPGRFTLSRPLVLPAGIPPVPPLPPMQFDSALAPSADELLRFALSSRKPSPTLVPETVEEEPSESENLDGAEEKRKAKEVRFEEAGAPTAESARPTVVAAVLPTKFDEPSLLPPQELGVPDQKTGRLTEVPSKKKRKEKRWTLSKGKSAAVAA